MVTTGNDPVRCQKLTLFKPPFWNPTATAQRAVTGNCTLQSHDSNVDVSILPTSSNPVPRVFCNRHNLLGEVQQKVLQPIGGLCKSPMAWNRHAVVTQGPGHPLPCCIPGYTAVCHHMPWELGLLSRLQENSKSKNIAKVARWEVFKLNHLFPVLGIPLTKSWL